MKIVGSVFAVGDVGGGMFPVDCIHRKCGVYCNEKR